MINLFIIGKVDSSFLITCKYQDLSIENFDKLKKDGHVY